MIHTPWQHATADTTYDPARILCYDSEFVRERSYIPKLALVQTCQPGGVAQLYDPLNGDIPWATILRHPAPTVMHAAALNIHPDMLAPGRVLKHYIAKPDPASPLLTGWRAAFYRDHLTKLL